MPLSFFAACELVGFTPSSYKPYLELTQPEREIRVIEANYLKSVVAKALQEEPITRALRQTKQEG